MKQLGIVAVLFCFISQAHAFITVETDRTSIGIGEGLTLTITTDTNLDNIDLAPIAVNFTISGKQTSNSISIVNGKRSDKHTLTLQLLPKRQGILVIPALQQGSSISKPLQITVTKTRPTTTGDVASIQLEIISPQQKIWVNQQVIVAVKLYYLTNKLREGTLTELTVANAHVEFLGQQKSQVSRDGYVYQLLDRRYAVFPTISGKIDIQPVRLQGSEVVQGSSSQFFGLSQGRALQRISNSLTIQALPPEYTDAPWIVAGDVRLQQTFDTNTWRAGEPIGRKLSIIVNGMPYQLLPKLQPVELPGSRVYQDKSDTDNQVNLNGVIAKVTDKQVYIPTNAGQLTLPAMELKWWNPNTQSVAVARLGEKVLQVMAATQQQVTATIAAPIDNTMAKKIDTPLPTTPQRSPQLWWLALLSLGFNALLIIGGVMYWWSNTRSVVIKRGMVDDSQQFTELQLVMQQQDVHQLRFVLNRWFAVHQLPHIKRISELTSVLEKYVADGDALAKQVHALDRWMFHNGPFMPLDWLDSIIKTIRSGKVDQRELQAKEHDRVLYTLLAQR